MDIFTQYKLLLRTTIFLVILNLITIGFFVFKEIKTDSRPLLFPKKEKYKSVIPILKKELNLTNNQVAKFEEIRKRNFIKQSQLKQIIKNHKDAMNIEMFNKSTNNTKVITLAKQIADNEYKMELLRYQEAKELKTVCTPEQLAKFEDLVKEIRDYFRPDNQPANKKK